MSSATRRGGIPGPESRTGLTRPSMTEAEFERRLGTQAGGGRAPDATRDRRASPPTRRRRARDRRRGPVDGDPRGRGRRGRSRPSPGGSSGCSPSRKTWTRSSGSTPSTWARTAPRSSTTCSGRSSPRWSCTTRATAAAARSAELAERALEADGDGDLPESERRQGGSIQRTRVGEEQRLARADDVPAAAALRARPGRAARACSSSGSGRGSRP